MLARAGLACNQLVAYHRSMLRREVVFDAPADEVWRALSDPAFFSDWFGAHVVGSLAPGRQIRFTFPDGVERAAAVEDVLPHRSLIFRWLPFERATDGSTRARPVTRIEFHVSETAVGTLVVFIERALSEARAAV